MCLAPKRRGSAGKEAGRCLRAAGPPGRTLAGSVVPSLSQQGRPASRRARGSRGRAPATGSARPGAWPLAPFCTGPFPSPQPPDTSSCRRCWEPAVLPSPRNGASGAPYPGDPSRRAEPSPALPLSLAPPTPLCLRPPASHSQTPTTCRLSPVPLARGLTARPGPAPAQYPVTLGPQDTLGLLPPQRPAPGQVHSQGRRGAAVPRSRVPGNPGPLTLSDGDARAPRGAPRLFETLGGAPGRPGPC